MIGIVGTGIYLPEGRVAAEEIAAHAGLPVEVVRTKMSIEGKTRAGPDDHASTMALAAAGDALEEAGVDPAELDVVISSGSQHKDHLVWSCAAKIAGELGARNAFAFEVVSLCSNTVLALKIARDFMVADRDINTILVAGGHRTADLVDYGNPRTRFLFSLSDGGSAIVLRRDAGSEVLASVLRTDGRFADSAVIAAGGSRLPASADTVGRGLHVFDVADPETLKTELDPISLGNFVGVIRDALARSECAVEDVTALCLTQMKRSMTDAVCRELGLPPDAVIRLDDVGHIGAPDQVLALQRAVAGGIVGHNDVVVLAAAGLGFTWGATVVRWVA